LKLETGNWAGPACLLAAQATMAAATLVPARGILVIPSERIISEACLLAR